MTEMPDVAKMAAMAKDVHNAIATLQSADPVGTKSLAEDTKRKVEAFLTKYEEASNDFTRKTVALENGKKELAEKVEAAEKALSETKKNTEEYKKRLDALEIIMAKKGATGVDPDLARETPEYKNFFGWFAYHPKKSESLDIDLKTLRSDSETQGAYLIPQVMDNVIRKNIVEMSPVRMFARVRQATSKTMEIPRRLAIPTAVYEGEGETSPSDQSQYGSEQVTLYRQTVTIPATLDMMVSSAFNLEQEIAMDVGEAFGKGEGMNFISGTGVKGPQGIIKDSRIEQVNTSGSGAVIWDDLITIASKLKRGQNPAFFFNRRTLGILQKLKSTIGVPIWAPVAGDKPATIWGFPYNSDMIDLADADAGTGALPIVFGDLRRGYEIYDLIGISVVRDDLTRKKEAITEWTFRRYNTGRVIIPEAIKVLKVA